MADCVDANKAISEGLEIGREVIAEMQELADALHRVGMSHVANEINDYANRLVEGRKLIKDAWGGYLRAGVEADFAEQRLFASAVLGVKSAS